MAKPESRLSLEMGLQTQILAELKRLQGLKEKRSVQGRYRVLTKNLVHKRLTSGKLERLQRCLDRVRFVSKKP